MNLRESENRLAVKRVPRHSGGIFRHASPGLACKRAGSNFTINAREASFAYRFGRFDFQDKER